MGTTKTAFIALGYQREDVQAPLPNTAAEDWFEMPRPAMGDTDREGRSISASPRWYPQSVKRKGFRPQAGREICG